jgi:L-fuconolactonase
VIDAHHHLWDLSARKHRWLMGGQPWASDDELEVLRRSFTLADLAPLAAAAGTTGTVVIQTAAEPWETPDLLALAGGDDPYQAGLKPSGPAGSGGAQPAPAGGLLAGVVGWTDLTAPDEADPGWLARPADLPPILAATPTACAPTTRPCWPHSVRIA